MFSINYRDPRPIYEQIKDSIRKLIISGAVVSDEKLPSVRELAQQLAINPNTIQRAYRELEADGYLYSVPGKGNFACDRHEVDDGRKKELLQSLQEAIQELRYLGVTQEEIMKYIEDGRNEND